MPITPIKYRPEIDGLRAIAVLSVLAYHMGDVFLGYTILPGGFLGVDVFFVISGFLITSIIHGGLENQTFSIAHFYERRVRRILPLLLIVVLATTPFAYLLLLPEEMQGYANSGLASIFFVSNFWFWTNDPYWAEGLVRPLLHTWSLGVEEQFYLFAPLILALCYRIRHGSLSGLLMSLSVVSLFAAHWASSAVPQAAFFLLPFRLWEITIGALLAIVAASGKQSNLEKRAAPVLPKIGLCMIVAPFFLFSSSTAHPSLLTLIPVSGVVLVIRYSNEKEFVTQLLSNPKLVWIGLISYGLYLWHYPILAFASVVIEAPSSVHAIVLTVFCVVLSYVTYLCVERPTRRSEVISFVRLSLFVVVGVSILTAFFVYAAKDGLRDRFPEFVLTQEEMPPQSENYRWFGELEGNSRIILVGDSHMMAIAPELKRRALSEGYNIAFAVDRGCQFILGARRVDQKSRRPTHCVETLQQRRLDFIKNAAPSTVIIGGRLPVILEESGFNNREGGVEKRMRHFIQNEKGNLGNIRARRGFIEEQMRTTVAEVEAAGHQVVLLYPIPEVGWHVPKKLMAMVEGHWQQASVIARENPIQTKYKVFQKRSQRAYELLDSLGSENVIRIFPERIFCNKNNSGKCETHDAEHLFYRDEHHPSRQGAVMIVDLILSELEGI